MPGSVAQISLRRENVVLRARSLDPLRVDEHRSKILRKILLHLIILVHRKHSKGSRRIVAAALDLERQVVEIVESFSAAVEKRSHVVAEPQRGKNVHVGFTG